MSQQINLNPREIRKVVVAGFVGTAIEWYDFFLYGAAAALVFNEIFFPSLDAFAGQLASFATFAVGFFARPVGGMVFGHYGDRIGRKSMLVISLALMGVATFLIGLLPTYNQIGIWAPVFLVALRFIQGFGVGGEWGGAVLLAAEHAEPGRRGFYASFIQMGAPAGQLLASGVFAAFAALPREQFLAWGWRVPFLLGIFLLAVGMVIRLRILESPLFSRVAAAGPPPKIPLFEVLAKYPKNVVLAMGARMAENVSFYLFTVFILSYAKTMKLFDSQVVLNAMLVASVSQMIGIPFFGALSDKLGRRPVYLFGAAGMALFIFPFFTMVQTANPLALTLALCIGLGVFHSAMYGPQAAFFSELFGTRVRYSGASLGYQLASPLAGGIAPMIATSLLQSSAGSPSPVAWYLIAMVAITLLAVYFCRETSKEELG